ncbi:hypothetical protein RvY_11497-2 [Ramazzottius varieornatus]|uniref:Uncharacterized protein n=1 Tax=Ramazzottius varieornatus TaxID=947166 RepID=A0A1D1VKM7_RAMVA|nr:hypothetical protein RvY_11497-2 [Ramazzottius varieornatus]
MSEKVHVFVVDNIMHLAILQLRRRYLTLAFRSTALYTINQGETRSQICYLTVFYLWVDLTVTGRWYGLHSRDTCSRQTCYLVEGWSFGYACNQYIVFKKFTTCYRLRLVCYR